MSFARRVTRAKSEPICEPPTGEDWEEWTKMEEQMLIIAQELNSSKRMVSALKEKNASEEEISNAEKKLSEVFKKDMTNYNRQVSWSCRFGFLTFDQLEEARAYLE